MGKGKRFKETDSSEKKPRKRILWIVVGILVVILLAALGYGYSLLQKMNMNPSDEDVNTDEIVDMMEEEDANESADENLPEAVLPTETTPTATVEPALPRNNENYGLINIAVFGMDNRYRKTIMGGRSDVNIILTIDTKNNEIRLTSVIRDLLIYIPAKEDYNRINAAIVYEKSPEKAVEAIEQELDIEIDHYMITSFVGMTHILDAIGGVDVKLSWQEVWDMNGLIMEMNRLMRNSTKAYFVQAPGDRHLNGIQAVAYMRLRQSDGGFARDDKQKEVLASAKNNLSTMSLAEINDLVNTIASYVKTDMEPLEMLDIAAKLYALKDSPYKTTRIPYDNHYTMARYKGMAIIQYDKEYNIPRLHDFIYDGKE